MKNIISIILFLIISLCTLAQNNAELDEIINVGKKYIKSRDFEAALGEFNKALNINNNYAPALSGKIESLTLLNNLKEAYRIVNEAIENMPDYADFYYNKGLILNYKKQYRKAIENFNKALELNTSTRKNEIFENRGAAKQKLNNKDEALMDYSKAIELNPNNSNAFSYRGFLHYSLENYSEAIQDFTSAINIDASNPYSYYNKGMSHIKLNDNENACIEFHRSCKLGNENACKMIISYCTEL